MLELFKTHSFIKVGSNLKYESDLITLYVNSEWRVLEKKNQFNSNKDS